MRLVLEKNVPEAAAAVGVSARTADRVWAFARAWLHRELAAAVGLDSD